MTCFTQEHQKFLSIALASLPALPLFLKGFFHCPFIFYFTLSSCRSHSQLLDFIFLCTIFLGVYYNSIIFPIFCFMFLQSFYLSFFSPILSCPSPSAEGWMDGTKWLWINECFYSCVWDRERERDWKIWCVCVCVFCICVPVSLHVCLCVVVL